MLGPQLYLNLIWFSQMMYQWQLSGSRYLPSALPEQNPASEKNKKIKKYNNCFTPIWTVAQVFQRVDKATFQQHQSTVYRSASEEVESAFEQLDLLDAVKFLLEERGLPKPTLATLYILWKITRVLKLIEFHVRATVVFLRNLLLTGDVPVTTIRIRVHSISFTRAKSGSWEKKEYLRTASHQFEV